MHFSIATSDWARLDCFVVLLQGGTVCSGSGRSPSLSLSSFSFLPPYPLKTNLDTKYQTAYFDLVSFFTNTHV